MNLHQNHIFFCIFQEKCEDDILKLKLECEQKIIELIRKEESAISKKDFDILKLKTEMDFKVKVRMNFMYIYLHILFFCSIFLIILFLNIVSSFHRIIDFFLCFVFLGI